MLIIKTANAAGEIFSGSASNDAIFCGDLGTKVFLGVGSNATLSLSSSNVGINCVPSSTYALDVSGLIRASGDVVASSDIRLKENLVKIPDALAKVKALSGYTFNRTDDADKKRCIGVVAQEVLAVVPEAVQGNDVAGYSVAYGNLTALLIEAIKELSDKVDVLMK
jgi:hypothetical protein